MSNSISVRVPATSANIGPGFDTIGVALDLHNVFYFDVLTASASPVLRPRTLVLGEDSLAHLALNRLYEKLGKQRPKLFVQTEANIPFSRGLGSSSTAVVGGLLGGNALLGNPLDREEILALALEIEGHPDNVAPALFGGFQIAVREPDGTITRVSVPAPEGLKAVVCIPELILPTEHARAALPESWTRAETVANLGRVAVLMTALLSRRWELLRVGMDDHLHQPYREKLIPGFRAAVEAALAAGAYGAALSGSGSALLAFTGAHEERIGEAMAGAIRSAGVLAQWMPLNLDASGATVLVNA
ncbi:homoserine kinase [Armatimonas sp.]|uniref:homoserine kinase n=1 Tax=Armatimonas sp. TaxID=1872638 RepID=UPI00374D2563